MGARSQSLTRAFKEISRRIFIWEEEGGEVESSSEVESEMRCRCGDGVTCGVTYYFARQKEGIIDWRGGKAEWEMDSYGSRRYSTRFVT